MTGTYPFTLARSVKGFRINTFLHDLTDPAKRAAFLADEEKAFETAGLSETERDMVRRRDWRAHDPYGVSFFMLEKLGAVVGVSNLHIYAAMRGETLEQFQKTRNAPGALYSVAGTDAPKLAWDKEPASRELAAAGVTAQPDYSAGCAAAWRVSIFTISDTRPSVARNMNSAMIELTAEHQAEAAGLVQQRDHRDRDAGADEQREIAHRIDAAAPGIGGVARQDHVVDRDLAIDRRDRDRQRDHQRNAGRHRPPTDCRQSRAR